MNEDYEIFTECESYECGKCSACEIGKHEFDKLDELIRANEAKRDLLENEEVKT